MDIVLHNCIIPSIFYVIYTMLSEKEFLAVIGKTIHNKRNLKKISCERLAELSEVDYSSLNLIENAKQTPRSYTLYKILYSLDIDILGNFATHSRNVETSLIHKIKMLDEASQRDLLKFLDEFYIKAK